MFTSVLQAVGLFMATNIDDIIVLSLFFAPGAGVRGTTGRIVAGQYLGLGGILIAPVVVLLGAVTFLPESATAYLGFSRSSSACWPHGGLAR